jgi:hypothetical protein
MSNNSFAQPGNTNAWVPQTAATVPQNTSFSSSNVNGFAPAAPEVFTGFGGRKAPPPVTDYPER